MPLKDQIKRKEYFRQYKQDHKEERNEHKECDCGGCYAVKNKASHFRTLKHTNFFNKEPEERNIIIEQRNTRKLINDRKEAEQLITEQKKAEKSKLYDELIEKWKKNEN